MSRRTSLNLFRRAAVMSALVFAALILTFASPSSAWPPGGNGGGSGGAGGGGSDIAAYSIIPFAPPNAATIYSAVADINEQGCAVGGIEYPDETNQAVHLDIPSGVYTLLQEGFTANSVNNLNQVVGAVQDGDTVHAAFWSSPQADPEQLLPLVAGTSAYPLAINDAGIVVGESQGRGAVWRVVVDADEVVHVDGPVELPPLNAVAPTRARDVTEVLDGTVCIVGDSDDQAVTWTVALNADGSLAAPSAPGPVGAVGSDWSEGAGINNFADVSGHSHEANSTNFGLPALAPAGQYMQPLSVPRDTNNGIAFDVNDVGEIVGTIRILQKGPNGTGPGVEYAWLWKDGTGVDLNKRIPSKSGWELKWAMVISHDGLIGGWGKLDVNRRGFVLIPNGQ